MLAVGTSRNRRIALAALVLPALLLAAVAAGSYRPFGRGEAAERGASSTFVDTVFTLAAVLLVLLIGVLLWARLRVPKWAARAETGRFSLLGLIVYLAVITAAFLAMRYGLNQPRPVPQGEGGANPVFPGSPVPEPTEPVAPEAASRAPQFSWPLAGAVAALAAAAIAVAVVVRRRREHARGDDCGREELAALEAALDDAIDDLRREPDPRRAVVAAYARMEQALTVFGLPRHPSEAPYEYLSRVGRELQAEGSVSSLTELFELAKFSSHAVDEPMRARAIESLTEVRDEVRAAA